MRKVIDPAVLQVNGLSDMSVAIEQRRRHSRAPVHEFALTWPRTNIRVTKGKVAQATTGTLVRWRLMMSATVFLLSPTSRPIKR
jgi:hypothetical protein